MEKIVELGFIGIIAFIGYRKFKRANNGKDCCK